MKRIIFACLAALVTTGAASDPMSDLIGSKTYWQAMNWEKAEQSKIWTMDGWRPFEGKQDSDKTFTKERSIEIDGKQLKASLIVHHIPNRRNVLSISITSMELLANECNEIRNWLDNKYGQAKLIVDASYKFDLEVKGNTVEQVDKNSQWDLGSTRVTLLCFGFTYPRAEERGEEKNTILVILAFGSKETERSLKPLFALRCTQQLKFVGLPGPPNTLDDVVFVIDENKKRVLYPNKSPLSGEHRLTEDAIEVKMKNGENAVEYFIDRITGAFKGRSRYPNGTGVDVSGRCDKAEVGERKF